MRRIDLIAPAKINLYLRVLGLRDDGYHEIDTLMVPISLADRVGVEITGRGEISVRCPGRPELDGPDNLAWRAAEMFRRQAGGDSGIRVVIEKNIPLAAGLGGGSSDAAAVLRALDRLLEHPIDSEELFSLAGRLGADVPFFLHSGPCRATGRGTVCQPVSGLAPAWLVLAVAPFGLSTAEVYNKRKQLTKSGAGATNSPLAGCAGGEWNGLVVGNDLQPASEALQPAIGRVCKALLKAGAEASLLTGSGPTVFGLCRTEDEARAVAARVDKQPGWRYLLAYTVASAR